MTSCIVHQKDEIKYSSHWKDYLFNPENIFQNISSGNKDIFKYIESDENITYDSSITSGYSVNEYLQITQAFWNQVIKEDYSNYQINQIVFFRDCSELAGRYDEFNISLFDEYLDSNEPRRIEYSIQIILNKHEIDLVKSDYSNLTHHWQPVDRSNNLLSVDDIEKTLLENGGREVFRALNNNCYVGFKFDKESDWVVSITQNNESRYSLELRVNSEDGVVTNIKQ